MSKVYDYSTVPATVTIKNESDVSMAIQLFRTNLVFNLNAGDSLVLTIDNSTELIYFIKMGEAMDKIKVTVS